MSAKQAELALEFFNETVRQFFDDLKQLYPEDKVLKMALAGILIYIKTSPMGLHDAFRVGFGPYFPQVLVRDEAFFLEHSSAEYKQDYKRMKKDERLMQDLQEVKEQYGGSVRDKPKDEKASMFDKVILKLKGEWRTMADSNKDVIWEYVTQLVHFSNRVMSASVPNEHRV